MAYTPAYTSEADIEGLLQITIDDTTNPTTAETLTFIEASEKRVIDRGLGAHTATDQYIDVAAVLSGADHGEWVYSARTGRITMSMDTGVIIPLFDVKNPIISVTTLHKNDESIDSAPSWDALTEWDGSSGSTHFMLLQSGKRDLGYALWMYDEPPTSGPKRLKMTYSYGHNVDTSILGEYCTYDVAIRVLQARWGTNEVDGMAQYDGGDLGIWVPRNIKDRIASFAIERNKIAKDHFPETKYDIAFEVV